MTKSITLPIAEDHGLRPRGHFGNSVVCGVFQPSAEDSAATTSHFGLSLYMNTQYATFRDEDGVWYNIQRVIEGELCHSAFVYRAGDTEVMPEGGRSHEGMLRWTLNGGEHLTEGAKIHYPGEPGGRNSEPLRLLQTADSIVWEEGELMSLSGPLLAGLQWYAPMGDVGMLFTAHPHRVSGTFLDKKVEGFLFNDQIYHPPGVNFAASPFFASVHVALVTGGTEYDDGTVEAFQIGLGRDRFAFALIVDQSGIVHQTTNITGVMDRDEQGFPSHITWDIDGAAWEWIADPAYPIRGLSGETLERDSGIPTYRGSEGRVRRVGDTRKPVAWMGYVESFAARG